jgi:hypothetical protein
MTLAGLVSRLAVGVVLVLIRAVRSLSNRVRDADVPDGCSARSLQRDD